MSEITRMRHRPKADTYEIADLLEDARDGKFVLPDFQRDLVWKVEDRIKLFDSIYRGFPIGDILFWAPRTRGWHVSNEFGPFKPEHTHDAPWLVVDGQQRLSTIFGCLFFDELNLDEKKWKASEWRFAFDPVEQRIVQIMGSTDTSKLLPLPVAIDTAKYLEWARSLPESRQDETIRRSEDFSKALRNYRIPYYVVHADDRKLLQEIFERVNTTGKALSATDVFNALFPTRLNDVSNKLMGKGFGRIEPGLLLQAVKVIAGMDPAAKFAVQLATIDDTDVREEDDLSQESDLLQLSLIADEDEDVAATPLSTRELLTQVQPRLEKASDLAVDIIQEAGIRHIEALPYSTVVPVLIHFLEKFPDLDLNAKESLKRLVWLMSAARVRIHGTYLRAIARIIRSVGDSEEAIRQLTKHCRVKIDSEALVSHHDWRAGTTRLVGLALFELRPRDLSTGEPIPIWEVLPDKGDELFRRIWGQGSGDLLSSSANRIIIAKDFSGGAYRELQGLVPGGLFGEQVNTEILESHAISADAWMAFQQGHREEFLRLRMNRMVEVVSKFLAQHLPAD